MISIPSRSDTDLEWMELHLRCLYQHDANDRMVRTRQPNAWPSPLFHLTRTPLGNLWRFRDDLDPAAIRELARLCGREPAFAGSASEHPPPERLEAIRSVLRSLTEIVFEWRGPAFRFPAEIREPAVEETGRKRRTGGKDDPEWPAVVALLPGDEELLRESFTDSMAELSARLPCFAAVEDGRAISLCYAARPLEVVGSDSCPAAEAGVETAPGHRGRGLAPRVVAAWARGVRELGGEPLYSTSWDNKASRAVARKLGLLFFGEDLHLS